MPVPAGAPQDLKWLTVIIQDPVAELGYLFNLRNRVAVRAVCTPRPPRANPPPAAPPANQLRTKTTSETELLGSHIIDGELAEGKRTTTTLPIGFADNDQPVLSVVEIWSSPELKIDVLVKSSDPRTGEITDRVTHLDRSEPDPSLFLPPPDYSVIDQDPASR